MSHMVEHKSSGEAAGRAGLDWVGYKRPMAIIEIYTYSARVDDDERDSAAAR